MNAVRKLSPPVEMAMETTGHYCFSRYAHLRQDNQINPLQSDALRGLFIAEVVRIGCYSNTEFLSEERDFIGTFNKLSNT